jgi:hypothetical protein
LPCASRNSTDSQAGIVGRVRVAPAGHAERGDAGGAQVLPLEQIEQLRVLGVRRREPGLDDVHPDVRQAKGHVQLLAHREAHALALHAIAQRGVVEQDALHHVTPPAPAP